MGMTDSSRGLIVSTILLTVLSLGLVVLRLVARRRSGVGLWYDDWMALLCSAIVVAMSALVVVCVDDGVVEEKGAFTTSHASLLYNMFVIQAVAHLGLALTKLLYILLYARVFSGPEQRAIFSFTGGLILVWAVVVLFLMIFRCNPVRDAWHLTPDIHCLDPRRLALAQSIPDVIFDVILFCLPIAFVAKLQMAVAQKIALAFIFGIGVLNITLSAFRLYTFVDFDSEASTWKYTLALLGSPYEVHGALTNNCLITLKPVLVWISRSMHRSWMSSGNTDPRGRLTPSHRVYPLQELRRGHRSERAPRPPPKDELVRSDSLIRLTAPPYAGHAGCDGKRLGKVWEAV